jgi:hypothetical protein
VEGAGVEDFLAGTAADTAHSRVIAVQPTGLSIHPIAIPISLIGVLTQGTVHSTIGVTVPTGELTIPGGIPIGGTLFPIPTEYPMNIIAAGVLEVA